MAEFAEADIALLLYRHTSCMFRVQTSTSEALRVCETLTLYFLQIIATAIQDLRETKTRENCVEEDVAFHL